VLGLTVYKKRMLAELSRSSGTAYTKVPDKNDNLAYNAHFHRNYQTRSNHICCRVSNWAPLTPNGKVYK